MWGPTIAKVTGKTPEGMDDYTQVKRQIGYREVRADCKGCRKTVISMACDSGDRQLASAFLDAGWENYIGTNVTAECSSALVFLGAFFSLMRAEDRDRPEERRIYSVREAADIARNAEDFPLVGTRSFVSYHREG